MRTRHAILVVLLTVLAVAPPHAASGGAPSFGTPTLRVAVPRTFAVADLDGDGNLDLIGADTYDTGRLVSARGDGHGGFGTPVALASAGIYGGVQAVGDLNGDHILDVVALDLFGYGYPTGRGMIYLGQTNGSFLPGIAFPALNGVSHATLADVNEDGFTDLLLVTGDYTIALYPGTGGTTFGRRLDYTMNATARNVRTGDFNGDGHLDLLVFRGDRTFVTYLGDGTGRFTPSAPTALPEFDDDTVLLAGTGDVDGDGRPDIAVFERSRAKIAILRGTGLGTFIPWLVLQNPDPYVEYNTLALGDFDRDGRMDVAASTSEQFDLFLQQSPGAFTFRGKLATSVSEFIGTPDLNHDGAPDVVMLYYDATDRTEVILNRGDATFGREAVIALSRPTAAAIGDVDGDGHPDIVAALYADSVQVLRGTASGRFEPQPPLYAGLAPEDVKLVDMDGDGLLDIVVANGNRYAYPDGPVWTNTIAVLRGRGGGVFDPPLFYPTDLVPDGLAIVDMNGDGRPDVVACHGGAAYVVVNSVSVQLNTGHGFPDLLGTAAIYPASDGRLEIAVGDVDGDGSNDVFTSGWSVGLDVYQGHADGTFTHQGIGRNNELWMFVALGQFTADAHPDVVVGARGLTELWLLPGGRLPFPTATPLRWTDGNGYTPEWLDVADVDGDGHDDVLVAESEQQPDQVTVLPGRGNGTFDPAVSFPLELAPLRFTIGDIDGDGDRDIVVVAASDLLLLVNNAPHASPSPPPDPVPVADAGGGERLDVVVPGRMPVVGALRLACTLPGATAASLELVDVAGRRRWAASVAGAGRSAVDVPEVRGFEPGVYWITLRQGRDAVTRRIVLAR